MKLNEVTDQVKAALDSLRSEFKYAPQGRDADFDREYMKQGNGLTLGVRYWGDWKSLPKEDGEGDEFEEDDDHQVPTPATIAAAKKIIAEVQKKFPSLKIDLDGGEKNWTYITVKPK